jgi:hypothetical protein
MSKIAGKVLSVGAIQIRSSIVGRDAMTTSGIYSWFKSASLEGPVDGFANHLWNGVSTTAFARLSAGMLLNNRTKVTDQHWLLTDTIRKLTCYRSLESPLGGEVIPVNASQSGNKILAANFPYASEDLWELAGYSRMPSIPELRHEFTDIDRRLSLSHESE